MSKLDDTLRRYRDQAEEWTTEANVSEIVTEFVETRAWKEVILPQLEARMRRFKDKDVWDKTGEDLAEARGEAKFSRLLKRYVECRVGQKEACEKRAGEALMKVEALEKQGRIPDKEKTYGRGSVGHQRST